MMCLGGLILGYAVACLQMYRFAAAELVPSSHRARAISWVTAGGVVAGVIGPSLVRWTHDQWVPLYLATYAGMVGVHLAVFTIMSFVRFPSPKFMKLRTTVTSVVGSTRIGPITPATTPPAVTQEIALAR